MSARVAVLIGLVLAGAVAASGCGGGAREKGKNQDLDRPKATDTRR